MLAAADPECRIICVPEIAAQLRATSMLSANKLLVISPGGSADLGLLRITMVHANHAIDRMEMMMGPITSTAKKPSSGTISGKSAASTTSSTSSALSFSGGASAGWIIQIGEGGPTIYHTGDTNIFSDMGLIDELYKPTHVLMPMGE